MMDIFKEIIEKKQADEAFVLATIIRTAGSSPRDAGAKMLVFPDGSISGTIGGGRFEKHVIADSLALLGGGGDHLLKTYGFSSQGKDAIGMACGGEAEVFMEVSGKCDRLIIFGGGHIGQDLARLAAPLDFRITVVDDRREMLDRLDSSVEAILTDSGYQTNLPEIGSHCYVVIVTKGHRYDLPVLVKVLPCDFAYIGMIGSKAKGAKVFQSLREAGIDDDLIKRIHTPIGLDIGAEGPYEIAISIAAELVAIRKKIRHPVK